MNWDWDAKGEDGLDAERLCQAEGRLPGSAGILAVTTPVAQWHLTTESESDFSSWVELYRDGRDYSLIL